MTNNVTSDVEAIILWRDIPSTDDARSGDRGILPLWMTLLRSIVRWKYLTTCCSWRTFPVLSEHNAAPDGRTPLHTITELRGELATTLEGQQQVDDGIVN